MQRSSAKAQGGMTASRITASYKERDAPIEKVYINKLILWISKTNYNWWQQLCKGFYANTSQTYIFRDMSYCANIKGLHEKPPSYSSFRYRSSPPM